MQGDAVWISAADVKTLLHEMGIVNGYEWYGEIGRENVELRHKHFSILVRRVSDGELLQSDDPDGLCRIWNASHPHEDGDPIFFVAPQDHRRGDVSVNILSERRLRRIGETIGAQVVWGLVKSHHESGRYAFVTTVEHQHFWFDRKEGEFWVEAGVPCPSSCGYLFGGGMSPDVVRHRAMLMRNEAAAGQDEIMTW